MALDSIGGILGGSSLGYVKPDNEQPMKKLSMDDRLAANSCFYAATMDGASVHK